MNHEDYEDVPADENQEEGTVDEYAEASEQYSAEQAAYMAEHSDDPNVAAEYAQEAHDHLENCEDAPSGLESHVEDTVYEAYYGDIESDEAASNDEDLTENSFDDTVDHTDYDISESEVDDSSFDSHSDIDNSYSDAADDTMDAGASENTY